MKVLKFLVGLAAAYVLLVMFFKGAEAVWLFCLGLTGIAGIALALVIFGLLPCLVLAWLVFNW